MATVLGYMGIFRLFLDKLHQPYKLKTKNITIDQTDTVQITNLQDNSKYHLAHNDNVEAGVVSSME
jgi:hypothetical protein